MYKNEYDLMYETEESHWWFSTKRNIVFDQFEKHLPNIDNPRILDVGIGTGIVLAEHARRGEAYGVELSQYAIETALKRNIGSQIIRASASDLPFASCSFDAVTCLDVLYHKAVESDRDVLLEIFRVLRPGGLFIMTDSAMRCLWGKHDISMETARRYHCNELEGLLNGVEFDVLKVSYMNFFLFPFMFAKRKIENLLPIAPRSDVGKVVAPANFLLKTIFGTEKFLLRHIRLPFGASVLAVARKPL